MNTKWTANRVGGQHGRTAIVTGANSGLGRIVARELARGGAEVVAACRDTDKGTTPPQQSGPRFPPLPSKLPSSTCPVALARGLGMPCRARPHQCARRIPLPLVLAHGLAGLNQEALFRHRVRRPAGPRLMRALRSGFEPEVQGAGRNTWRSSSKPYSMMNVSGLPLATRWVVISLALSLVALEIV